MRCLSSSDIRPRLRLGRVVDAPRCRSEGDDGDDAPSFAVSLVDAEGSFVSWCDSCCPKICSGVRVCSSSVFSGCSGATVAESTRSSRAALEGLESTLETSSASPDAPSLLDIVEEDAAAGVSSVERAGVTWRAGLESLKRDRLRQILDPSSAVTVRISSRACRAPLCDPFASAVGRETHIVGEF